MPGRKPATIATAGNALQSAWTADPLFVVAGAGVVVEDPVVIGIIVGVELLLGVAVCEGELPWSALRAHVVPPLHE